MDSLADRVRWLIDVMHGGNVYAAAKAIGVSQPALRELALGMVKNPRARTLQKIAEFHGTTMDWLLRGEGEMPLGVSAERLGWVRLVQSLALPPDLTLRLEQLPLSVRSGHQLLLLAGGESGADERDVRVEALLREAETYSVRAWRLVLEDVLARVGRAGLARALEAVADQLRLGFSVGGTLLFLHGKLDRDALELVCTEDAAEYESVLRGIRAAIAAREDQSTGDIPAPALRGVPLYVTASGSPIPQGKERERPPASKQRRRPKSRE